MSHLAASKEWQIDILEKREAELPAWIEPPGDNRSWDALLAQLNDAHKRLMAALEKLNDEDLLNDPILGLQRTLLELVLSSGSAHECHHGGQISYLRGLQGI